MDKGVWSRFQSQALGRGKGRIRTQDPVQSSPSNALPTTHTTLPISRASLERVLKVGGENEQLLMCCHGVPQIASLGCFGGHMWRARKWQV